MRKYLFIFGAVLAYLLLSSRSCEGPDQEDAAAEEARLARTKERIIIEFESDDLSRQSLRAFEVKAGQKLTDLADYLHIYADQSMDESFRGQARQMILDLFISDSVRINGLLSQARGGENVAINEFLSTVLASGPASLVFDSVEVDKPLHRIDEFNYIGIITFSRRVIAYSSTDTSVTGRAEMQVDIIASKIEKTFGADTLQIWGVFLGDMKSANEKREAKSEKREAKARSEKRNAPEVH